MIKKAVLSLALLSLWATAAVAANYIEPKDLKVMLDQKKPVILVDIQPAADFAKQHLPGSIETNAFPAKTEQETARLDKVLELIKTSKDPVVVICPRGKGGAKNTYSYFQAKGVPESRMQILTDGIAGWPFADTLAKGH